ncbi:unnamed protein product [Toxocara canis]|uniref:Translation initiation factor eIF2B subunit delta n=1 Tax=Toxocara canis TaxID=6265 RepID=A0A3P7I6J5_TOXCA|nr:unnamed protein product [Toxocara canis]
MKMGGGKKKNTPNNRQGQQNTAGPKPQQLQQNEMPKDTTKENRDVTEDRPPGEVTAEMKELIKSVIDLKITNDVTQIAGSSQTGNASARSGHEKKGANTEEVAKQPSKSKEEVMAERKARAAEAKARKAAAAAAKKAAKEGVQPQRNGRNENEERAPSHEKGSKGGKAKEPNPKGSLRKAASSEGAAKPNGNEAVKSAFSSGTSSSRPSQPFKRVHFDMTPSEGNGPNQRERHPSFTDVSTANVHPAFLNFAARCEAREVIGIDAVCVAFIHAFKEFLNEYKLSENRKMSHDLDQAIRPHFSYLTQNGTQPFPLALGNLIRQLKKEINQLPDGTSELDGKNELMEWLDDFCSQNFDLALRAISSFCLSKMESTNYVLTYSWCPVVERVLLDAYEQKLSLHVCVLDSPVEPRGRCLAKTLCSRNIACTYGMLNAIGYVIKQCRLVLLGCSAILSNGFVVADRGASQVALVAAAANVPVLVAAQTLKFVDRVQTFDRSVREVSALVGERQETIPADLVTAVVTELRIVPPSSAPAVLKAKQLAVG